MYNFGQNIWHLFFKETVLFKMLENAGLDLDLRDRL